MAQELAPILTNTTDTTALQRAGEVANHYAAQHAFADYQRHLDPSTRAPAG